MPKRKSDVFCPTQNLSLSSLDAAFDILACETFTRLDQLSAKFEAAAGIKLNEGVVRKRWEDAVQRYFMMKGLDGLSCAAAAAGTTVANGENGTCQAECSRRKDSADMDTEDGTDDARPRRPLPSATYPGIEIKLRLTPDEVAEWRRWSPKVGDVVLIDLPDEAGFWPGKIIDKKAFFQGRTVPRGNHFFPVRIYNDDMEPTITIKSRLLPLSLRPDPPLLASEAQLSAYNHAANPSGFDTTAISREAAAAHLRTHPGVSDETDMASIKAEKEAWNKVVNWVMTERRVEKLRALEAERHKRLFQVASADFAFEAVGERCSESEVDGKKRRTTKLPTWDGEEVGVDERRASAGSIFGPAAIKDSSPVRSSSPARSLPGLFRPALSIPTRPISPRKLAEKKRVVLLGVGEKSPRSRGGTYTPPRILPSGDETAPERTSSPVPSRNFDFVSPLGPVRLGLLSNGHVIGAPETPRRGNLEPVKEEVEDGEGWMLVRGRKAAMIAVNGDAMTED